jgi:radical SAM/Cys-rich protein
MAVEKSVTIEPFQRTLSNHGLKLVKGQTETLQINLGFLCNQTCKHCHLSAGPYRKENMNLETVEAVVGYAQRSHFKIVDITGGAPELNPHLITLIAKLYTFAPRIVLRSNLSALNNRNGELMNFLSAHRVVVIASFPSLNESQADSQRGRNVYQTSISTLKELNALGYGQEGSGLELNLVSNPTGAFLSPSQSQTEKRFRDVLNKTWGISFNSLLNFANVPLGRFRDWLVRSGNFQTYMDKLVSSFNSCAVAGLMCRSMVSVSWDGYLYDCDFNLARGLYMGGRGIHVFEMPGRPAEGSAIPSADHCYTCTAGSGFT